MSLKPKTATGILQRPPAATVVKLENKTNAIADRPGSQGVMPP